MLHSATLTTKWVFKFPFLMCCLSNDCGLLFYSSLPVLEGLYHLDSITWEVCLNLSIC